MEVNREKRPYEAPKLLEYGELQKLTRGVDNGSGDSGPSSLSTKAPCWIAEVLYGENDPRTHVLRAWLNREYSQTAVGAVVVAIYRAVGQRVAALARSSAVLCRVLRPLFDCGLRRAQRHYMSMAA